MSEASERSRVPASSVEGAAVEREEGLEDHVSNRRTAQAQRVHQPGMLADRVPALYSYVDRDQRYRYVNRRYAEVFRRSPEEIVGLQVADLLGAQQFEIARPHIEAVLRGEEVTYEAEFDFADRHYCMYVNYVPDLDEQGRVQGFFALVTNITKRKEAEEAQRLEHELNEGILNTSQHIVLVLDTEGRVIRFNKYMEDLSGWTLAEAKGLDWFDNFLPECDRDQIQTVFRRALDGERTSANVNAIVTKDGQQRDIEWCDAPLTGSEGQLIGLVCTGQDISEERRAQRALRESEERLRAVLDAAVDAIVTIDHRGAIVGLNAMTEQMFGYAKEELMGRNVRVLMPSPYHDEHDGYIARYLKTGEARIIGVGREVVGLRKDGSTFPVDLSVSEVGHLDLFTGIIRDVSQRKKAENQLRQSERLASIGTLAAGLGHDMNNVLLPVRARLDIIESKDLAPAVREHFGEIRKSMKYMQDLADGLHLLALDPEDTEASTETTELKKWWEQTRTVLRRAVPKHVEFSESIGAGLPEIAVPPHRLTQAILNLLVNAGGAVADSGRVRLWAQASSQGTVRVGVTDNGTGMSPEVKERALEPFFTTKSRGLGTGLGLSLVQGVVGSAGGTVAIESEPGEGTTIVLAFPSVTIGGSDSDLQPLAVVTVEDERTRSLLAHVLEAAGFAVSAETPAMLDTAAVWVAEPRSDVLKSLRSRPVGQCDCIILGAASPELEELGCDFVEKPYKFDQLRAAVSRAAERVFQ